MRPAWVAGLDNAFRAGDATGEHEDPSSASNQNLSQNEPNWGGQPPLLLLLLVSILALALVLVRALALALAVARVAMALALALALG